MTLNFWSSSTSHVLELQVSTSTSGLGSARDQTQGFVHTRQRYQLSHIHSPRPAFPVSQETTRYLTLPFLTSFSGPHLAYSTQSRYITGTVPSCFPRSRMFSWGMSRCKIQSSDWKCVRSTLSSTWLPQQTYYPLFTSTRTYHQNAAHLTATRKPVMMIA